MEFKTQVKVEIDYKSVKPEGYSYESRHSKSNINYHMDVEFKTWGIKGISISMPQQTLSLELELTPDQGEDYENHTLEVQVDSVTIEEPESFKGVIVPQELELNISKITRTGTYSFQAIASGVLKF